MQMFPIHVNTFSWNLMQAKCSRKQFNTPNRTTQPANFHSHILRFPHISFQTQSYTTNVNDGLHQIHPLQLIFSNKLQVSSSSPLRNTRTGIALPQPPHFTMHESSSLIKVEISNSFHEIHNPPMKW